MALKMLYNVGWFRSGSVVGAVYLLENADTGKRYLAQPHDHDANAATAVVFLPMGKSVIETMIAQNNAAIAAAIPYSSIEEDVPTSQKNGDGHILVENLPAAAADVNAFRLTNADQVAFFSKRGVTVSDVPTNLQSVTAQNLQLWKSGLLTTTTVNTSVANTTGGTTTGGGTTTTTITGIAFVDTILLFFWNNPILMALGIFLLLETFGITNILGFKKRKRRR